MRAIHRLLSLTHSERRLMAEAALLLVLFALVVRFLSFRTISRFVLDNREKPGERALLGDQSPGLIPWAINAMSNRIPGTRTCLIRSLAAKVMFARRGIEARIRLGVGRDDRGSFRAHAWIESEGKIVLGQFDGESYETLPPVDSGQEV
jgi:hypothetical protein